MFSRLFGSKDKSAGASSTPPPTNSGGGGSTGGGVTNALEKLNTTIELLEKRELMLDKKIEGELAKAKQFMEKKNKTGALQCMKRKKAFEDQKASLVTQKMNMETMKDALEVSAMNRVTLEATKHAASQLQKENKAVNAEQIEDQMEDIREAMDQHKAVQEALGTALDDQVVDEDELMAELEDAMAELEEEAPPAVTVPGKKATVAEIPAMPAVPSNKLPAKKPVVVDEDEEALRQLEAELNS
jgi:charged multivesicular body protein 4